MLSDGLVNGGIVKRHLSPFRILKKHSQTLFQNQNKEKIKGSSKDFFKCRKAAYCTFRYSLLKKKVLQIPFYLQ